VSSNKGVDEGEVLDRVSGTAVRAKTDGISAKQPDGVAIINVLHQNLRAFDLCEEHD